jgi:hypothetical protein
MASDNLDFVRAIYAEFERGDWSSTEWADPEIEFVFADGAPRGSWKGLAGMAKGWREYMSAFERYRIEADEYRELDGERLAPPVAWARGPTKARPRVERGMGIRRGPLR